MATAELEIPVEVVTAGMADHLSHILESVRLVCPGEEVTVKRDYGTSMTVYAGEKVCGRFEVEVLSDPAEESKGIKIQAYLNPDEMLRRIVGRAAEIRIEQEQAAHPTRLIAFHGRGNHVKRVMFDGRDVTKFVQWADPVVGEVGMYPNDGEKITDLESGSPLQTLSGTVEVTFEEGK